MPMDVDHDGFIAPLDILILINYLNSDALKDLRQSENTRPIFLDVDRDNSASSLDVLTIINYLNRSRPEGEGEGDGLSTGFWSSELSTDSTFFEVETRHKRKRSK